MLGRRRKTKKRGSLSELYPSGTKETPFPYPATQIGPPSQQVLIITLNFHHNEIHNLYEISRYCQVRYILGFTRVRLPFIHLSFLPHGRSFPIMVKMDFMPTCLTKGLGLIKNLWPKWRWTSLYSRRFDQSSRNHNLGLACTEKILFGGRKIIYFEENLRLFSLYWRFAKVDFVVD